MLMSVLMRVETFMFIYNNVEVLYLGYDFVSLRQQFWEYPILFNFVSKDSFR